MARFVARWSWVLVIVTSAGCLPELEVECSRDDDCTDPDRPRCISQICAPAVSEGDGPISDGPLTDGAISEVGPPDGGEGDGGADACASAPTDEVCNGIDDDCDGRIDESVPSRSCYSGDPETQDRGLCRAGEARCVDGTFATCEGEIVPVPEVCSDDAAACDGLCNGLDDDCDGSTDEELLQPCGPDQAVGLCERGTRACILGLWDACRGAVDAQEEICDGEDNDCDLSADEELGDCDCTFPEQRNCYSGPPGTLEEGVCAEGTQACTEAGRYGRCEDQILPSDEACDGVDNDCDGQADEGLSGQACSVGVGACRADGTSACDALSGMITCNGESGTPVDEVCNGIDDDCDGAADEVFRLGEPCSIGEGVCARNGVRVCGEDGRATCDAVPGVPRDEACNGLDDDCDGRADEGEPGEDLIEDCYEHPTGNPGVGACEFGERRCLDGNWTPCAGDEPPLAERCNQADDDCNGVTDDVAVGDCSCTVGEQQNCYGGPEGTEQRGVCRGGSQQCVELEGGATNFGECIGEVLPGDEVCNDADDDCDGTSDEGEFGPCMVGDGACVAGGVWMCADGELACMGTPGAPSDEVCNGIDDNCNGVVDDIDDVACVAGVGACENSGVLRCEAGESICDARAGDPGDEVCNGIDDDCNGLVDDTDRQRCTVGEGACARDGQLLCEMGEPRCMGQPGLPQDEACNGADDDCDGIVDEGTFGDCRAGLGECEVRGELICQNGETACDVNVPDGRAEECSGRDEDCDGSIDEMPEALCDDPANATSRCVQATCDLTCSGGFFDVDADPENGCERGCGAQVNGQEINADGVPLAAAGRPGVDEFAIAWLDDRLRVRFSLNGGAMVGVSGPLAGATRIDIVGVQSGYTIMVDRGLQTAPATFDIPVVDGAIGLVARIDPIAIEAVPLLVAEPADGVALVYLSEGVEVGQEADNLTRLARDFGAEFVAPPVSMNGSGGDWRGPPEMDSIVLDGQTVIVGGAVAGNGSAVMQAYFHEEERLDVEVLGPFNGQQGASVVAGAYEDEALIMASAAVGGLAWSLSGSPAVIQQAGAAEPGEPGAVHFGPDGPVISVLTGGNATGVVFDPVGGAAPVRISGPVQMVGGGGGAGSIGALTGTVTGTGRSILVWRDRQNDVRWADTPCQ